MTDQNEDTFFDYLGTVLPELRDEDNSLGYNAGPFEGNIYGGINLGEMPDFVDREVYEQVLEESEHEYLLDEESLKAFDENEEFVPVAEFRIPGEVDYEEDLDEFYEALEHRIYSLTPELRELDGSASMEDTKEITAEEYLTPKAEGTKAITY